MFLLKDTTQWRQWGLNLPPLSLESHTLPLSHHSSWSLKPSRLDWAVCLFCCFTSQVNSYGHGGTVSWPNHTFSWASLNKQLTSNSCTYFRLYPTTTLLEWISGREENDCRKYFMINLNESMGPGRDRTRDPWICSQTRICCTSSVADCTTWPCRLSCTWSQIQKISFLETRIQWCKMSRFQQLPLGPDCAGLPQQWLFTYE